MTIRPTTLKIAMMAGLLAAGCAGETGSGPQNATERTEQTSEPLLSGLTSNGTPTGIVQGSLGSVIIQPHNACGNEAAAPSITSAAVTMSTDGAPLERGGVVYASGGGVRIDLATDGCTYVQSVTLGSQVLTPQPSNGRWYSATDTASDTTAHAFNVWVLSVPDFLPDGSTDWVTITVGRSAGAGAATYSFPLVHVKSVQPALVDAAVGKSGVELFDSFASSIYAKFNFAANTTVVNGHTLYGYDPSTLGVYIDPVGIWFEFRFKVVVPGWCDPTVRVSGTFAFDANDPGQSGLSVRWVNPVNASFDWGLCSAIDAAPLLGDIFEVVADALGVNNTASSVQASLTQSIQQTLQSLGGGDSLFLDGTATINDELLVSVKLPFPSIEISVPYDAYDMGRSGTLIGPSQRIAIVANGLGMTDAVAGLSGVTLESGPNGVPNDTLAPNARTVARSGVPVDSSANVGQLLARTSQAAVITKPSELTTSLYRPACAIETPASGSGTVSFGVNDTAADAQRLRAYGASGYDVRVFFDAPTAASTCAVSASGPVLE